MSSNATATPQRSLRLVLALAALVGIAGYLAKPLLIVDETRYAAVAWEMWSRSEFLVPHLNGAPYSHKPPLLFWLINAGWSVTGVNVWWPRALGPLALLLDTLLLARLARYMWPDRASIGPLAGMLFCGMLFPLLFSTALMFDLWVTLWTLLGWTALLNAHRGVPLRRTASIAVLALALGLLTKGPVLLLYFLPPCVAARFWSPRWRDVLRTGLIGVVCGATLALAWALPAALQGGPEYRDAILWGQTAGRIGKSFGHTRPFWWYLPLLPLMLFPWAWWPRSYRGWRRFHAERPDIARFLFWCIVPQLVVFSALSSKQPHYLLPLLPLVAAALAANFTRQPLPAESVPLPMILPTLLGTTFATSPLWLRHINGAPDWLRESALLRAGVLLLVATALARELYTRRPDLREATLACQSALVVLALLWALGPRFRPIFDVSPAARRVAQVQAAGRPVAFSGARYSGQLHFLGRLTQPIANPHTADELSSWLDINPDGLLLLVARRDGATPDGDSSRPLLQFGSRYLQLWDASQLANVTPLLSAR